MIGYYVHHQGSGHLHRATALAAALDVPVTGLSSLPRPAAWAGEWIELERDDRWADEPVDTAGGHLHWAPLGEPGLRSRMAAISSWIADAQPRALVSDVSVEVALLARLHGVPLISVVLPGDRGDRAHRLGQAASSALVAFWPEEAEGMVRGVEARLHRIGAVSRFPVREAPVVRRGPVRRVVVLGGRGGEGLTDADLALARAQTPGWDWEVLGGEGPWLADPFPSICDADVVVTHAGQNAIAEVAAARRPAIVVPADRPHDEQRTTARALAAGPWPVVVEPEFPATGWADRLERAAGLDGSVWSRWCDGRAPERFAALVGEIVGAEVAR
ncbi:glycosyltransferase [Aeromicrobium choanae]|uniref:UDP-N-acetylglucosamine:LPS N-acetylglucosamine transferase n=1 Tax=Aeromicrobium choanae TaxID=1736691 RepID=A0A1T4Z4W5_9ACTN|nr:glycosyltransferase [Aeromicrobium choanae]SKB09044.1 UDP-N-acetylglucosamine:LPS N-acetylglucosamine transferase [Aeromicrobium choanae]